MTEVIFNSKPALCSKWVTIGVPFYKRLEYLPSVLKMVAAQDYPFVELIISDNGENGTKLREIVEANYSRPYKFRQNPSSVDVTLHLNQILREASGEFVHLMADDDEISPNFASELVHQLEQHPKATLAYAKLEIINNEGLVVRKSKEPLPAMLSGPEFIRATWERYEYNYQNLEGFITRTKLWQQIGGYPEFCKGNHIDNAAVIGLCLNHNVVFNSKCVYRHRVHPEGFGWTVSMRELAASSTDFLRWLDTNPTVQQFAVAHSDQWRLLKRGLVQMIWGTYLWRWRDLYKDKLTIVQWIRDAFRMPFLPGYYKQVVFAFRDAAGDWLKRVFTSQPANRPDFFEVNKSRDVHAKN